MREKLVKFRANRSQREMAEKYGVTQQAWDNWEKGTRTPSVVIMAELEKDSGVKMENLFPDIFQKGNN